MESSLFAFAIDVVGEGPDTLVAAAGERGGVTGISFAAAYHHARDILPHNPLSRLHFHEGGTVFFHPQEQRYGKLRPQAARLAEERDPLAELCTATERRSMQTRAWTVYLHNSRLGMAHPECAPQNALGDRLLTDLCPAHPEVRHYAVALTADVVRYPIRSIMAEALHFKGIEHGFHHERYFLDLGETARFLLGLCFCRWCMERALAQGVAAEGVRQAVQRELEGCFESGAGGHEPLVRERIGELAGGEMSGFLDVRSHTVASLVADVHEVATAADVRLTFSAHGGSAKGGRTHSTDAAGSTWTLGVDMETLPSLVDEFEVLGYGSETADIESTIAGYTTALDNRTDVVVALRPMWPDTTTPDQLIERVRLAAAHRAARLDFYHYGLMPERSLDWIAASLRTLAQG